MDEANLLKEAFGGILEVTQGPHRHTQFSHGWD